MMLHELLHLTGCNLPRARRVQFRQRRSRGPGHPDLGLTPGVETATGPLG